MMNALTMVMKELDRKPSAAKRNKAAPYFEALIGDLHHAIELWREATHNEAPDEKYSFAMMLGPERSRRLHEVQIATRAHFMALCAAVGGPAARIAGLEDNLIEEPYRQRKEGETFESRRQQSIAAMETRIAMLSAYTRKRAA